MSDIELSFDGAEGTLAAILPSEIAANENASSNPYLAYKDADDEEASDGEEESPVMGGGDDVEEEESDEKESEEEGEQEPTEPVLATIPSVPSKSDSASEGKDSMTQPESVTDDKAPPVPREMETVQTVGCCRCLPSFFRGRART
mmetsp:Transcript_17315/g.32257  ORF Transcript_17315/g.32257 Transcript_17315/m.32257 type:complete len:145 (-) Transcript_17315:311-745(-)|eukprot:CAMPEP_0197464266 /NCGR_PEP_ID=MMETSP1175-20131217/63929_1 /TAXON_ID=1003142 /ORGANISM="Triceratium dubium, Strain CCMP147" /LENGTH=144 /DNA_ID=CAMNT_0043000235 /DNA_START=235 /DNA_END=669 /DNA_ORIENTATION=-